MCRGFCGHLHNDVPIHQFLFKAFGCSIAETEVLNQAHEPLLVCLSFRKVTQRYLPASSTESSSRNKVQFSYINNAMRRYRPHRLQRTLLPTVTFYPAPDSLQASDLMRLESRLVSLQVANIPCIMPGRYHENVA
jgi:hypothetical protein